MVGAGASAAYNTVRPDANPIYFASHIRAPKLIAQGRHDEDTPLKTSADPLFKLLSGPKQRALFDGGHVPTTDVLLSATRTWLDEKLGAVRR